MSSPYRCVVDADNIYVDCVEVTVVNHRDAETDDIEPILVPQHYRLKPDESLINATPPTPRLYAGWPGLVRPRWDWDAETWVEDASDTEIAAWEAEHPAPEMSEPVPDPEQPAGSSEADEILNILLGVSADE